MNVNQAILSMGRVAGAGLLLSAAASAVPARPTAPRPGDADGWSATFGSGTVRAYALELTDDGGTYVAGGADPSFADTGFAWVARLDAKGRPLWERALGGGRTFEAAAVARTPDGGCVVVGASTDLASGDTDGWAAELSADGALLWQKLYGGPGTDDLVSVSATDEGYYAGGSTTSPASGMDAWVLRLKPTGEVVWQRRLAGDRTDRLTSVATSQAGVVVCANTNSSLGVHPPFFGRPWATELGANGKLLWTKAYDVTGGDGWSRVIPHPDGGFVAVGEVFASAFFRGDVWIVRLDGSGGVLWDRRYGDNFGETWVDSGRDIQVRPDGGYAVLASTGTAGAGDEDLWLLGLDASGGLRWNATYGRASFDQAHALVLTPEGDHVLAGRLGQGPALPPDALVLRVGPEGGLPFGPGCDLDGKGAPNSSSGPVQVFLVQPELSRPALVARPGAALAIAFTSHVPGCNQ